MFLMNSRLYKGKRIRRFFLLVICAAGFLAGGWVDPAYAAPKKHIIKFSTLAPEGSSWMNEMRLLAKETKEATEGNLVFKFYPGGVSGDEKDVIRKMRIGQLHGAGFTGVGLGEILPAVRVFDLPFLFENDRQIQHTYEQMSGYFVQEFEKNGYILLGWVPVGWIHFFSREKVQTVDDLKKSRPWMWEGDPLIQEAYQAMNVKPVSLSVTDVLLSLQTGMVDTVYASSQGALALQWFTKVKYMSGFPMGYATGGVLITKKKFNSLPEEYQEVLRTIGTRHLKNLVRKIQIDNARSIEVMVKNGIEISPLLGEKEIDRFREAGSAARRKLVGKLFPQNLLDRVISHIREIQ